MSSEAGSSAYLGQIIRRGMDEAQGIVALFTADEWSVLAEERRTPHDKPHERERWLARQNVLFEAGMAMGINEERTVLVTIGDVVLPSDIDGRHTVRMSNTPEKRELLRGKLATAGCTISANLTGHHNIATAGDFDKCMSAPTKPHVGATAPTAAAQPASDADAKLLLEGWLNELEDTQAGRALQFSAIDAQAGVPPGTSVRLLEGVLSNPWSMVKRSEAIIILRMAPAGVIDVGDPDRGRWGIDY